MNMMNINMIDININMIDMIDMNMNLLEDCGCNLLADVTNLHS